MSGPEEEAEAPVSTEHRKTTELCGSERDGLRCMLPKGHAAQHEAHTVTRMLTWPDGLT